MTQFCSVCAINEVDENSAILVMGASGTPRCLCAECESDFDEITGSSEYSVIENVMERISKKMSIANTEDNLVLKTVKEIMENAAQRAKMIKDGIYDTSSEVPENSEASADSNFSSDKEEIYEEIPEEYLETEEDRELDRKEEEKNKKIDRIINIICIAGVAVAAVLFIYSLLKRFI